MKTLLLVFALLTGAGSLAQVQKDSFYLAKLSQPGVQMVAVHNSQYNVFTQKIGNGKINLLLLHGGPANGHEYFENFPAHLNKEGITVYYFDQLGSYYSDNPLDSTAFTPAAFVEHVEEVRKALKLDNFYLLGHSWGGMLAELYAQKYQQHLKGLILSNVPGYYFTPLEKQRSFDDSLTNAWLTTTKELPAFMAYPRPVIDSVFNGQALADTLLSKKLHRMVPKALDSMMYRLTYFRSNDVEPEPLVRNNKHITSKKSNPYLYKLQSIHQQLDYKSALLALKTKTLLLGSAKDYMYPQGYYDMQQAMTGAKVRVHITPNGAHFAMWDDTANYFNAIRQFIKDVEKRKF
ncbi:MAG TPA: alpha/beta fold hydrolase [Flavisolibacter sp.]|nr:alpha/beta fold hydrolase [Flavisolibacter sp.]